METRNEPAVRKKIRCHDDDRSFCTIDVFLVMFPQGIAFASDTMFDEPQPCLFKQGKVLFIMKQGIHSAALVVNAHERTKHVPDDLSGNTDLKVFPLRKTARNIHAAEKCRRFVNDKDLTMHAPEPITEEKHFRTRIAQAVDQGRR